MLDDAVLLRLATQLSVQLRGRDLTLVTAESCTGGWIGKVLTDLPGSSAWYRGGAVSYSNLLKTELLGVAPDTLARFGAVSAETAREMAAGAITRLGGECSIAVTGIAGPDGGTIDKPVGTVWFGWAWAHVESTIQVEVALMRFTGDRESVRRQTVAHALERMNQLLVNA